MRFQTNIVMKGLAGSAIAEPAKTVKVFNHRHRYLFIAGLSVYTFLNTVLCDVYGHFDITVRWYYSLLTIWGVTLITWEGNRLVGSFVLAKNIVSKYKIRQLVLFYMSGNLVALIAASFMVYIIGTVVHGYDWSKNTNPLKLNIIYGGLINLFFHLLNTIVFFFNEYRKQSAEAEELRHSNAQAELQRIRTQINPHFLFNNLNVLSAMVIKDNPDANYFIEEFSKVYRYILNNEGEELVELSREMEFIEPYVYLLKKRFTEGLTFSISIPESYKTWHIVPAALQILIENAIKHNVVSRSKPLHISIHVNGDRHLVVKNNLQPREFVEPSTRIGLQNIYKRYEILSDRKIAVKSNEGYFEVILPLLKLN